MESSNSTCLACDTPILEDTHYHVLHKGVGQAPTMVLLQVVRKFVTVEASELDSEEVVASRLHSTLVCSRCFQLFSEFEDAERRYLDLREGIVALLGPRCKKYRYDLNKEEEEEVVGEEKEEAEEEEDPSSKVETVMLKMEEVGKYVGSDDDDDDDDEFLTEGGVDTDSDYEPAKPSRGGKVTRRPVARGRRGRGSRRGRRGGRGDAHLRRRTLSSSSWGDRVPGITPPPSSLSPSDSPAECSFCGKNCHKSCAMAREKPFHCRVCSKRFGTRSGIEVHVAKQHAGESAAELVECSLEEAPEDADKSESDFEWKMDEDKGVVDADSDNSCKKVRLRKQRRPRKNCKNYECPECGKFYRTPSELETHKLLHSGERPFICEVCGQAYKHRHALEVHVEIHRGQHRFQCHVCQKVFTQKCGLQRHLPLHTGECPYQCDVCGKRFLFHSSFSIHKLTHSGEKPYKCQLCGAAFMSASHLKRHLRVHSGEKPHRCQICCKAFAEKYNLEAHVRIHTGNKLHRCNVCGAGFDRRIRYEEHIATHGQAVVGDTVPVPPPPPVSLAPPMPPTFHPPPPGWAFDPTVPPPSWSVVKSTGDNSGIPPPSWPTVKNTGDNSGDMLSKLGL